jgi:exodeoxyribonuclease V beta subunit
MQEFNCLDVETSLSGKLFVEASAGTGKTFAIEHVVARLILQKIPLSNILITTFTNAGVRDLRRRIYQNIQNLLESNSPPPYLEMFPKIDATLSLKNALRLIDEAEIHTIHSFCYRMLSEFSFEANIDTSIIDPEKGFRKETLEIATLDVLRTLVDADEFSPAMLTRLMAPFRRETKNFVKKMISFLSSSPILPDYSSYKLLQEKFSLLSYDARDALLDIAPSYNKVTNRSGEIHNFVKEQIEALAQKDFEKLILSTPSIFELFKEENRKKSSSTETHDLIKLLAPILFEASDPFTLFCRVAKKVQKRLEDKNEGPNILLETMCSSLANPVFKQKINHKFKVVIIDEFQDTDPLQWKIFSSLSPELLLVVGDPKQSIYAFRGANLQTFLDAKKNFSKVYKLSSNYRSDPALISSLNKLFQTPNLFTLSEKAGDFSYEPLQAKKASSEKLCEVPLEFIISSSPEEETLFSFIAYEIQRIKGDFSFAILVKDRYEAFRLTDYLQNLGLSVLTTATANITEGPAFKLLLLGAKISKSPKNISLAKEILAHPFIGWSIEKIKNASDEDILTPFIQISQIFKEQGLASFLTHLHHLLHIENKEDYADFMQLVGLVLEANPESLQTYLEKLSLLDADDHPYLKRKPVIDNSKIHIMTSHMSKGLEFDIVFALGTAAKSAPAPLKKPLDEDVEKIRLFYVAATRAKEKLYLFIKQNDSEKDRAPIELLLAKLKSPEASYENLPTLSLEEIEKTLTEHQFSYKKITAPLFVEKATLQQDRAPPPVIDLPPFIPPKQYSSFSSLTVSHQTSPVPKESDLPPGPHTGNLFHLLLEKMIEDGSYFDWDENRTKIFIEKELFKTHLEGLETIVYEHLHAAFFTPLSTFCLKDVPPEYMLQEHSFCFEKAPRAYMKGFIDLVFLYENKIYILDWKMNLLSSYTPETIDIAMKEHSYYTQAEIYKEALQKSFQKFSFGNTFYFFLRGKENGVITL